MNSSPTYLREYDITIHQPVSGYRFSADSLLLADFVRARKRDRILELGAGCGVISLIIAKRFPDTRITTIEIQKELAGLARENVSANGLNEQVSVIEGDLKRVREMLSAGTCDHVVTNPPFRTPESGRLCMDIQEAHARHEILTSLENILDSARFALRPGGRISLIYPSDLMVKLLYFMRLKGLEPKRIQFVHPSPSTNARMVLVEGCKDAGEEVIVLPPEFLNQPL